MMLIWPICELHIQWETLSKTTNKYVESGRGSNNIDFGPPYGFIGTSCSHIHEYVHHIHTFKHTNTHIIWYYILGSTSAVFFFRVEEIFVNSKQF